MTGLESSVMLLIGGLVLLWWSGDRSVRYAVEITEVIGISSFTVGFIIISIATGLPEITTAILSSLEGVAGLSAGDILGSSLVNLSLVLGITTVAAGKIAVDKKHESVLLKVLGVITLLSAAILVTSSLTAWHGAMLLLGYIVAVVIIKRGGMLEKMVKEEKSDAQKEMGKETVLKGPYGTAIKLLGSLVVLLVGARLTVSSAINIGDLLGIPVESLGATVLAIGTGLPELSLELNAVKRGEYSLAVGDIFGSTLVNLTLILGLLSVISPTYVNTIPLAGTMIYLALVLVFLWYAMVRNHGLDSEHGVALILIFIFYLIEEIGVVQVVYLLA
ncbi:MAG: hypothetical protein SVV03_06180 [Candidatus Nanohaloarchaea archaeon]|nr:hypothetical protein [Candidatus Nanohaloarchaea archaeon]